MSKRFKIEGDSKIGWSVIDTNSGKAITYPIDDKAVAKEIRDDFNRMHKLSDNILNIPEYGQLKITDPIEWVQMNDPLIFGNKYHIFREKRYLGVFTWTNDENIGPSFLREFSAADDQPGYEVAHPDEWYSKLTPALIERSAGSFVRTHPSKDGEKYN